MVDTCSNGELMSHIACFDPMLYRLEERRWIEGAWVERLDERRRRAYKPTAEGRERSPISRGRSR